MWKLEEIWEKSKVTVSLVWESKITKGFTIVFVPLGVLIVGADFIRKRWEGHGNTEKSIKTSCQSEKKQEHV